VQTARERQPQLRQAVAALQAATARSDQARSGLLPQLAATANYQRTTANFQARPGSVPSTVATASASSFNTFNYFNDSIALNQLIYDFGQTTNRYSAAEKLARSAAESEQATELLVVLNVETTFFTARADNALVRVAQDTLDNLRKHLFQTQRYVEVGNQPAIALAQQKAAVSNGEVQLITAQNAYASAKVALNQAMGIEGAPDYDVSDETLPEVPGENATLEAALAEALKGRPEVAALQDEVRAEQLTVRSLQGQFGPTIAGNVGFTQGGPAVDSLAWNFAAGVTLTWQIFQGGLTVGQVHEAEANLANFVAQLDAERQQISVEVNTGWLGVRAAKATLSSASDALVSAREQLRLAERRYETGIGNIIELGDAQVAATSAAAQVVQAAFQLATSRAQFAKAIASR
jgi:outer membrane protein